MKLSLDYDKTYTQDPILWDAFIESAKKRGHEVVCVTMRYPTEEISIPCEVIYTSRIAKAAHARKHDLGIDVWIDDSPHWIFQDAI